MSTMTHHADDTDGKGPFKGWHFLVILLAVFGVVFTVNGIFLYNAITSFPGEDVRKSYTQGIEYNDRLAARARQEAQGWSISAGLVETSADTLQVEIADSTGNPVAGLILEGKLRHPANVKLDETVTFDQTAPGIYTANLEGIAPGNRDVLILGRWQAEGPGVLEARKAIEIPGACDVDIPEDAMATLTEARVRAYHCDER